MAPTIGPTVGGYLTNAMSWHWLFFVNIIPGIAVTAAALAPAGTNAWTPGGNLSEEAFTTRTA